ncbi:uncharacterized protein RCH25_038044 [Pelodytes ibericus]
MSILPLLPLLTLLPSLPLLTLLHPTNALLEVSAPSSHRALNGSEVLLQCTFSVGSHPVDPKFLAILWLFHGKQILRYDNKALFLHPRVSFNEQAAQTGDASISVSNVSIGDGGIYTCLVIYSPEQKEKQVTLDVLVPPVIKIHSKDISNMKEKLVCSVTGFYPAGINIFWLRDGEVLRDFEMGKIQRHDDGTFQVDSMVTVTSDRKNQTFSCKVQHESLQEPLQQDFQPVYGGLLVQVPVYSVTGFLVCIDQTFDIQVPIPPISGKGFPTMSVVWPVPGTALFLPKKKDEICGPDASEKSHAPLIITVILVLSLFGAGMFFIWKKKSRRKAGVFTLNDIHGPGKLIDGEEVTLWCRGTNCAGNTRVTWLEERTGNELIIILPPAGQSEEVEQLLNRSYVITTKREGRQDYSTSLRFIFCVKKHKGVTFICRFISDQKTQEKCFQCEAVYAPQLGETIERRPGKLRVMGEPVSGAEYICRVQHPSLERPIERSTGKLRVMARPGLVEPIDMTLEDCNRIRISLNLRRFYPREIEITWRYIGKENERPIKSKKTQTESEDLTFNVTSEFIISVSDLINPQNKLTVEWKHESLAAPESRSLGIRDLPWRPQMGDIILPKLEADHKVSLSCQISGYLIDKLSVEWTKMEKGLESDIELPRDHYKVPAMKSHRQGDHTLSCEARLTLTPHLGRDQGAEFICRVMHPTLEHPLERRTGPLLIEFTGKPRVSDIKRSKDGSFSLDVERFYPRDIRISWRLEPDQTLSFSPGDISEHQDGTYRVTSTCESPMDKMDKEKSYHLTALVEHQSLESPIQKTVQLKNVQHLGSTIPLSVEYSYIH